MCWTVSPTRPARSKQKITGKFCIATSCITCQRCKSVSKYCNKRHSLCAILLQELQHVAGYTYIKRSFWKASIMNRTTWGHCRCYTNYFFIFLAKSSTVKPKRLGIWGRFSSDLESILLIASNFLVRGILLDLFCLFKPFLCGNHVKKFGPYFCNVLTLITAKYHVRRWVLNNQNSRIWSCCFV
jgi:hypothetical protein